MGKPTSDGWAPSDPSPLNPVEVCERCGKTKGDTVHHTTSKDKRIASAAHEYEKPASFLDDPFWKIKARRVISKRPSPRGLIAFFVISGAIILLLVRLLP